jgi:hypothetical protein
MIPSFFGHVHEWLEICNASVVDDNLDRAELCMRGLDACIELRAARYIDTTRNCLRASADQLESSALRAFFIDVPNCHPGAFPCEALRRREPDTRS